jgi:hypothetical protein
MSQIGNAVPPILAHCVAKKIAEYIDGIDRGEKIPYEKGNSVPMYVSSKATKKRVSTDSLQKNLFTAIE